MRHAAFALLVGILASIGHPEVLHVDGDEGHDQNPGTAEAPLRTIGQASKRVNDSSGSGPATILIAPGRYELDRCVTFGGARVFTEQARLTIRAAILPAGIGIHARVHVGGLLLTLERHPRAPRGDRGRPVLPAGLKGQDGEKQHDDSIVLAQHPPHIPTITPCARPRTLVCRNPEFANHVEVLKTMSLSP